MFPLITLTNEGDVRWPWPYLCFLHLVDQLCWCWYLGWHNTVEILDHSKVVHREWCSPVQSIRTAVQQHFTAVGKIFTAWTVRLIKEFKEKLRLWKIEFIFIYFNLSNFWLWEHFWTWIVTHLIHLLIFMKFRIRRSDLRVPGDFSLAYSYEIFNNILNVHNIRSFGLLSSCPSLWLNIWLLLISTSQKSKLHLLMFLHLPDYLNLLYYSTILYCLD